MQTFSYRGKYSIPNITLVNVYVDLVIFTGIAVCQRLEVIDIGVNTI